MDNAFGSENLFGRAYKDLTFFVVFSSEIESSLMLKNEISKKSPFSEISAAAWLSGSSISVRLEKDIFNDRLKLEREVGRLILSVAGNLINRNSPN